jgi:hypothetical protein
VLRIDFTPDERILAAHVFEEYHRLKTANIRRKMKFRRIVSFLAGIRIRTKAFVGDGYRYASRRTEYQATPDRKRPLFLQDL